MKTLLSTLLFCFAISITILAQEKSADDLIVEGIYQEEVVGDLGKAAETFNQILAKFSNDRKACAQAMYHLGLVEEKKAGEQAAKKAERIYASLLEKYPEVGDYTELARTRLDKIRNANTFLDSRDSHKYKWVKIGEQVWMGENLAFMPWVNPPKKQEYGIWVYDYNGDNVAEAKATENYQKYGCLYDWPTAMALEPKYLEEEWTGDLENHQGLCPPGWRMPSDGDWMDLGKFIAGSPDKYDTWGDESEFQGALKIKTTKGWTSGGNGNDELVFSMKPAGIVSLKLDNNRGSYQEIGRSGYFWTSSQLSQQKAQQLFKRDLNYQYFPAFTYYTMNNYKSKPDNILWRQDLESSFGMSIRCIKTKQPASSTFDEFERNRNQGRSEEVLYELVKFKDLELELDYFITVQAGKRRLSRGMLIMNNSNLIYWNPYDSIHSSINIISKTINWQYKANYVYGSTDGTSGYMIKNGSLIFNTGAEILFLDVESGEKTKSFTAPNGQLEPIGIKNKLFIRVLNRRSIERLICLSSDNGKIIWEYKLEPNTFMSRPISFDNTLIANLRFLDYNNQSRLRVGNKKVIALNAEDGTEVWAFTKRGEADFNPPSSWDQQLLFLNRGDSYIYSLNSSTGAKNWRYYTRPGASQMVTQSSNSLLVASSNIFSEQTIPSITALAKNGHEQWKKILPKEISIQSRMFVERGVLFLPIRFKEDNLKYRSKIVLMDLSDNEKTWIVDFKDTIYPDILFAAGKIVIWSAKGIALYNFPELD